MLRDKFHPILRILAYNMRAQGARVVCLEIPDKYAFMDPALVALLKAKVTPLL